MGYEGSPTSLYLYIKETRSKPQEKDMTKALSPWMVKQPPLFQPYAYFMAYLSVERYPNKGHPPLGDELD